MRVTIDDILSINNKTRFWLSSEIGCHYQSLCNLCNGKSSSISFDLMKRICLALNCSPSDIFKIED